MRVRSFRRQAVGAKGTRKEMRFDDARRQRRLCREAEASFAATRRRFRRTSRKRPFARPRMNSARFSNNEEMSAAELIRPGKPLKLIPRSRRCWQTFYFPFIGGYRVRPVHLQFAGKRYGCKRIEKFTDNFVHWRLKGLRVAWVHAIVRALSLSLSLLSPTIPW